MTEQLPTSGFSFRVWHVAADCAARRSTLGTPHGTVELPAFMPVGTQATVKGLDTEQVRRTGAQMVLCNTYHLALRPGHELIGQLGGLHAFMGWQGPILTDSGGFQVFSLAERTQVTDDGVCFRSHIDGRAVYLTPELAMQIQQRLGSDIAMVLDHVVGLPGPAERVEEACLRSLRWAARCRAVSGGQQAQFGIVQGGLDESLRVASAAQLQQLDFDGYAIGGLSVGETPAQMYRVLEYTCPVLPTARPRYLMGVGRPQDLLQAIRHGVDLFDCVMPTRNGRNALAFTDAGALRMRNECHRADPRPIEPDCACAACRHSRAYLRHLFQAREMLGPVLLSIHNLTYYQRLLQQARQAIEADRFREFCDEKTRGWQRQARGHAAGHDSA